MDTIQKAVLIGHTLIALAIIALVLLQRGKGADADFSPRKIDFNSRKYTFSEDPLNGIGTTFCVGFLYFCI